MNVLVFNTNNCNFKIQIILNLQVIGEIIVKRIIVLYNAVVLLFGYFGNEDKLAKKIILHSPAPLAMYPNCVKHHTPIL